MTISFIHKWNENAASYRYRAQIPAREIGASLNDLTADVLVFAKPQERELLEIANCRKDQVTVADVCDDHLDKKWFVDILKAVNCVTCSTKELQARLKRLGIEATHIEDPYEFEQAEPHCNGTNLLWFGHGVNINGLLKILPTVTGYPLRVVSNVTGSIPWSKETLLKELAIADIVIMPKSAEYKSPNRTVEAIRRGCFVVAEPHPALTDIPGIWLGNVKEGIEWTTSHKEEVYSRIRQSQEYIRQTYSPQLSGTAWRKICTKVWDSISPAAIGTGQGGSI